MKKLLIGTTNPGKFNEYKELLAGIPLQLLGLKDVNVAEPEETGKSFEANAILKAKYYFQKTGIPTLADDGGLEIEALHGEPGIYSNRWIGRKMTDDEMIDEVMKRMKDVPVGKRQCRMNVVVALASPFGVITSESAIVGVIADKPAEKRIPGYQYRTIIFLPNYNKYFVDLNEEELEILSHRKHAIEKIKDFFLELSK
jgi:XTP/dITP diphosphohydrolase